MSRKRKKNRKQRNLSGVPATATQKERILAMLKDGSLIILAAVAGSGAGAVFGKHSLVAGLPVTMYGIYKNNKYITAAGLGFVVSNGFQGQKTSATTQGVDGFDVKQLATEAKDRAITFFRNFSEKLYLPKSSDDTQTTSGLGEKDSEQVTYFVNPYSNKELDMSAIDRVQEQIAQMDKQVTGPQDDPQYDGNNLEIESMGALDFEREF